MSSRKTYRRELTATDLDPYERLLKLATRELELLGDARIDELGQLQEERRQIITQLPATPPASAREALEACALLHKRIAIEVYRARDDILAALVDVQRAVRAASGYAPRRERVPQITVSA